MTKSQMQIMVKKVFKKTLIYNRKIKVWKKKSDIVEAIELEVDRE